METANASQIMLKDYFLQVGHCIKTGDSRSNCRDAMKINAVKLKLTVKNAIDNHS